jgi:6-phosphogluconolactonase (cycloisomerase 2 family)
MIRTLLITLFLLSNALSGEAHSFVGHWGLKMVQGGAGWLSIEKENDQWSGQLWTVGESKTLKNIEFQADQLSFTRFLKVGRPEFPGGPPTGPRIPCKCTALIESDLDKIRIVVNSPNRTSVHLGKRLPPLPPKPDLSKVKFDDPITLFNGKDLTGWGLTNSRQKSGWKARDGILINETPKKSFDPFSQYGNLRTKKHFGDCRLTLEFKVPPGGNSGIYLSGLYEVQVVDRDSKMQGIHGIGSVFNRIAHTQNAGKPGGEWQSYDITIVDRHATVILNGEKVIDNQPILGNTNGALHADVTAPGPLFLQGDHTAVSCRNIVIRPVSTIKKPTQQFVILSLAKDHEIATYHLDPVKGSLTLKSSTEVTSNPTCMAVNKDHTKLYVAMKGLDSIVTYDISDEGKLTLVSESMVGAAASFLKVHPSGDFLLSSYYKAGKAGVHRIDLDGILAGEPLQLIPTDERAHCITFDPSGTAVFVPHTRPNAIHQFLFDPKKGTLTKNEHAILLTGDNTGPRHLSFHPSGKFAYGSDEQGSSITAYRFIKKMNSLGKLQTLTTLPPEGFEGKKSTSDIEVHPSGKFVFIANRGYNAIASFAIAADGSLTPIEHTPTEAVTRSFNITADGKHLIAAGQQSGNLAVFAIASDGTLTRKSTLKAGLNPWWVQTITR